MILYAIARGLIEVLYLTSSFQISLRLSFDCDHLLLRKACLSRCIAFDNLPVCISIHSLLSLLFYFVLLAVVHYSSDYSAD